MRKIILLFLFFGFVSTTLVKAQQCLAGGCTSTSSFTNQYPSTNAPYSTTSSSFALVNGANNMNAGNWTLFNVVSGYTYEWTYCEKVNNTQTGGVSTAWDAQLTLFNNGTFVNGSSSNTPICFSTDVCGTKGDAPYISWKANFTGIVRLLTTMYSSGVGCKTNSGSPFNKLVWRRLSNDLSINVYNVDGTLRNNAKVVLYNNGSIVQTNYTNSSGNVTFTNLANTSYDYKVFYTPPGTNPPNSVYEEYWGTKSVTINGISQNISFNRDQPYIYSAPSFSPTSFNVGQSTTGSFVVNNLLSNYQTSYVEVWTDRDQSSPWDGRDISIGKTIPNGLSSFYVNIFSTNTGTYNYYAFVYTYVNGGYTITDQYAWTTAFTINGCTTPIATFTASNNGNDIATGQSVSFSPTNLCSGCTYLWNFNGGNIYQSQQQNPSVTYNSVGTFGVSLVVSNGCGQSISSPYLPGFITVKPTSQTSIVNQIIPPNTYINKKDLPTKTIADPVKIPTLDYGYTKTLLTMNVVGGSLPFIVYYNSNSTFYNSNLGTAWSNNFDFKVTNEGDSIYRVHYGEGFEVPFIRLYNGNGKTFPAYNGVFEKLYKDPSTSSYSLTFKNGLVYYFDANGRFNYIKDRYGNTTSLDYDPTSNNLIKITGEGGRYWTIHNTNNLIDKITDFTNREINISYVGTDIIGISNPDSGITHFEYDGSTHLMTKVINPMGNTLLQNVYVNGKVSVQYDGLGKPTTFHPNTPFANYTTVVFSAGTSKVYKTDEFFRILDEQDENGKHIQHGYYNDNTDSLLIDKNGNITTFEKDSLGNITAIHQPYNINLYNEYGNFSLLAKQTDGEGYVTLHNRDALGNEIQTVLPDTTKINRTFDTHGQLLTDSNALNTTSQTYNTQGDVTHIQTPTGGIDIYTDAIGRDTAMVNQKGQRNTKKYNGRGLVTQFTDVDGKSFYTTYDANDNKTSVTDKKGIPTQFLFDYKDRQYATLNVFGDTLERKYFDERDFPIATKAANGGITLIENDNIGNPKKVINPLGGITNISRDNNGSITSSTDVTNSITTTTVFDSLKRNTSTTVGSISTSKKYNKNSWVKQSINARGLSTNFTFSAIGKIIDVEDPTHKHATVTYNPLGSPLNVTDPNTHTTKTCYDSTGRPVKYRDALLHEDAKTLDPIGNVLYLLKANGVGITSTYTATNKLKTSHYSTGENYAFGYDANDNLITDTSNTGISYFEYDSLNRPTKYTDEFGNVIQYKYYRASGNLYKIIYQNGKEVTYFYNLLNQITDVTDWDNKTFHYEYDITGRLLYVTYNPVGIICKYLYDENGFIINKTWLKKDSTVIYGDTLTRNAWGEVETIAHGKYFPKIKASKTYGAAYDSADQIIQDSSAIHHFDNSGNDTAILGKKSHLSITYTSNNLLISFKTDSSQISFGYDALFNRNKQIENGVEKRYVNNEGLGLTNALMEQDGNGNTTTFQIYGTGLLERKNNTGQTSYYIVDYSHSIVALVDDSANVTDRYIYTKEGAIYSHTGTSTQPYTFLGEFGVMRVNDSTAFVRARYLDLSNGSNTRFFNRDPYNYDLTNPQTINRYVYALNNAVNMCDYSGLSCEKSTEGVYDDYLTFSEAKEHYQNGNGTPVYVDLNKINLNGISVSDFKNNAIVYAELDGKDFRNVNDAVVHGTIGLELIPNTNTVQVAMNNHLEIKGRGGMFDFNVQHLRDASGISGKLKVAARNTANAIGVVVNGTKFYDIPFIDLSIPYYSGGTPFPIYYLGTSTIKQ